MRIAHLPLDLGAGNERGDGVDDNEIDRAGAHEHVGDLQGLLTCVGLRDQERVDVDAELLRVVGVEGVLGVDERGDAAGPLRVGDGVEGESGLTRGLRPIDFDDAAAREPANAERDVEGDRPGGDHGDRGALVAAETHDGALAELAINLGEGGFEGLFAICC